MYQIQGTTRVLTQLQPQLQSAASASCSCGQEPMGAAEWLTRELVAWCPVPCAPVTSTPPSVRSPNAGTDPNGTLIPAAVASFSSCVINMPACTRICLAAWSTARTLFMPSSRNVTDVMLLTGLTAEDGADAVEGSSTGLLSLLGWVRRELPGHVNGAVLWKALRDRCATYH